MHRKIKNNPYENCDLETLKKLARICCNVITQKNMLVALQSGSSGFNAPKEYLFFNLDTKKKAEIPKIDTEDIENITFDLDFSKIGVLTTPENLRDLILDDSTGTTLDSVFDDVKSDIFLLKPFDNIIRFSSGRHRAAVGVANNYGKVNLFRQQDCTELLKALNFDGKSFWKGKRKVGKPISKEFGYLFLIGQEIVKKQDTKKIDN